MDWTQEMTKTNKGSCRAEWTEHATVDGDDYTLPDQGVLAPDRDDGPPDPAGQPTMEKEHQTLKPTRAVCRRAIIGNPPIVHRGVCLPPVFYQESLQKPGGERTHVGTERSEPMWS